MYKCKECWNDTNFIERYQLDEFIVIDSWEKSNPTECNKDLMEVVCEECNANTEDNMIILLWWWKIRTNTLS